MKQPSIGRGLLVIAVSIVLVLSTSVAPAFAWAGTGSTVIVKRVVSPSGNWFCGTGQTGATGNANFAVGASISNGWDNYSCNDNWWMPGGTLRSFTTILKDGAICGSNGYNYNGAWQRSVSSSASSGCGGGSNFEFSTVGTHGIFIWSIGWTTRNSTWAGSV